MKILTKLILSFLYLSTLTAQNKILTFSKIENNPFANDSAIYKVALIPESSNDSLIIETLSTVLKNQPKVLNKFELYPYSNFLKQQKILGIKNLSSLDLDCIKIAREMFGIGHIISLSSSADGLNLIVRNSVTGFSDFSNVYMDTDSSTAFKDILKFFIEGKKAVYIDQGILDISFKPDDAKLSINTVEYSNNSIVKLDPGKYFIKVEKLGFETRKDTIRIESGKAIYKTYLLEEAFCNIQMDITPPTAKYKILNKVDSTVIVEGIGSIPMTRLQEGLYIIEISEVGFYTESRLKRLEGKEIIVDSMHLKRSFYIIDKILTNEDKIARQLKIFPLEWKYEIQYDLLGDSDDSYDIMLYLIDKNKPRELQRLNELKGDVGDDIKAGNNKKIIWNLEANHFVPQNKEVPNYYFYLEVD